MCQVCKDIDVDSNYYRTKHFIVKQELSMEINDVKDNILFSRDTFYVRNKKRDKKYEAMFKGKENIDGKRIQATAYLRNYVK